jgi:5'-nucleotidase
MLRALRFAAALMAAVPATAIGPAAAARNIVVTNDDGLTSNVVALYAALKAEGHDVVVSVPCINQSGMGAALRIGRPIGALDHDCLNGAAKAGAPGVGPIRREGVAANDFYYVDGTPVMAMLHGVDVIAAQRWGRTPDLVLSGPNEGQNLGAIILSSGTVGNAQVAAMRGIPAIALSAGGNTSGGDGIANPLSREVARRVAELVSALDARAGEGAMLPSGIALNVNFPDALSGARWAASRVGTYNAYRVSFAADLAASAGEELKAMAKARGTEIPALPGLTFGHNDDAPEPSQERDESVVNRTAISVSPMQAGYGASLSGEALTEWLITALPESK